MGCPLGYRYRIAPLVGKADPMTFVIVLSMVIGGGLWFAQMRHRCRWVGRQVRELDDETLRKIAGRIR